MSEEIEKVASFTLTSEKTDEQGGGNNFISGIIRLVSSPSFKITTLIALSSEVKLSIKPTSVTNEFTWTYTGPFTFQNLQTYFGSGKQVRADS